MLDLLSSNKRSQQWTSLRLYKAGWLLLAQPCSHGLCPLSTAITCYHSYRAPSPHRAWIHFDKPVWGGLAGAESVICMSASLVISGGRTTAVPPLTPNPALHTHTLHTHTLHTQTLHTQTLHTQTYWYLVHNLSS